MEFLRGGRQFTRRFRSYNFRKSHAIFSLFIFSFSQLISSLGCDASRVSSSVFFIFRVFFLEKKDKSLAHLPLMLGRTEDHENKYKMEIIFSVNKSINIQPFHFLPIILFAYTQKIIHRLEIEMLVFGNFLHFSNNI